MVLAMKELVIFGEASKKEIKKISISYRDFDTNLMDFLRRQDIPVASSCSGDGICLRCVTVNGHQKFLTCQKKVRDLFRDSDSETLSFSYL